MKRAMHVWCAACLLSLGLAADGGADSSRPAMLTSIRGSVEVIEKGASTWKKPGLMALLNTGDTLRTGQGAAATVVFFQDGHREKMCPQTVAEVHANALRPIGGKRVVVPRGGKEPALPTKAVIALQGGAKLRLGGAGLAGRPGAVGVRGLTELCLLSPLGSKLRSGRPTFAWTTVAGADAYRIVVKEPSGTVALERRLTQARLPYPSDLPALRPGVLYSWSVEALAGDQPVAQAGSRFGVLAPESLARLRQEETALRSVAEAEIGDTTGPILLSRLYQEYGLAGDAIQQLERAISLAPEEPSLHEELGELCRVVGWETAAQRHLQRAGELRAPSSARDGTQP